MAIVIFAKAALVVIMPHSSNGDMEIVPNSQL